MPRQNFLSRESFVGATETQARETIKSVPAFVPNIRLIAENKMIESYRFSYERPGKNLRYQIDISVLPLNDQYTRISLHGTHANGHSFHSDEDMAIALHDFEAAIEAALKGDVSLYKPFEPRLRKSKKIMQFAATFIASIGVFFLRKKLS